MKGPNKECLTLFDVYPERGTPCRLEQYLDLHRFELRKKYSIVEPPENARVKSTFPFDRWHVVEGVLIEPVD